MANRRRCVHWDSVHFRDQIFVKGYEFKSLAKNMDKNNGKNVSKNLSGKYSQKILDHTKQSVTDALKTTNSIIMEYQKTINLLSNTSNQPTKRRTKNWFEINDDVCKFKTSMLESNLCDYSDAYMLVKRTISNAAQAGADSNNGNK